MPLSNEEWRQVTQRNTADELALITVEASLPDAWTRMSPYDLMTGAAIIALHYDRKRMAEALRDRILHSQPHPDEMTMRSRLPEELRQAYDFLAGRFEATLFTLADQIETGEVGHAH